MNALTKSTILGMLTILSLSALYTIVYYLDCINQIFFC